MNHLLEIMNEKNVIFNFHAESKEDVIRKLVEHLVQIGELEESIKEEIIHLLMQREKSMSTGIGSGVAIPHCSTSLVENLKSVVAISPQGIEFDSIDGKLVQIFILLIVPKSKFQEHIKTLAMIAKTLNQPEERDKIIHSQSLDEIKRILVSA